MDCSSLEPYESCFVRKRSSTSSTIKQQVKNMVISFIEPKESFLPISQCFGKESQKSCLFLEVAPT